MTSSSCEIPPTEDEGACHRGHGWPVIGEMVGVMYASLVVLLVPFWLEILPDGAVLGSVHLLMLAAIAAVMLRRREEDTHRGHSPA